MPKVTFQSKLVPLLILICMGCVTSIVIAGWMSFWTDSEMWNAVVVRDLFARIPYYDFSVKPLFNLLLWLNFKLAELLSVHPMEVARACFALNAILVLAMFFWLSRRLAQSFYGALLLTALVACNSFFIKRFINVRSDVLVTTLILALMCLSTTGWWSRLRPVARVFVYSCFLAFSLALTPKAIFPVGIWALIFLLHDLRKVFSGRKPIFGMIVAFCAFLLYLLRNWHATQFFLRSFRGGDDPPYWSLMRLEHVDRLLWENLIVAPLLIMSLLASTWFRSRIPRSILRYFDYASALTVLLAFYPDRLPFFIASLLPFIYLPLAAAWPELLKVTSIKRTNWRRASTMVWAFCVVSCLYWSAFLIFCHNNELQRQYISWIERQPLDEADVRIYDSVGILPFSHKSFMWYVGPSEAGNGSVFDSILRSKVEVIPYTSRLMFLGPKLWDYLRENYTSDFTGLFVRKYEAHLTTSRVNSGVLREILVDKFPQFTDSAKKVYVRLMTKSGIDLTHHAQWVDSGGHKVDFNGEITMANLQAYKQLIVPPTASELTMVPIQLTSPSNLNWMDLFRFDSEI